MPEILAVRCDGTDERVKATMRGIRRSIGTAPRKKTPATAERIVAMALAAGKDMKGLRDRALLLLGFAGAFRRSELVALNVEDLEESELGFKVIIRHSKTDQEGAGQTIAIVRQRGLPSRRGVARGGPHNGWADFPLGQEGWCGGQAPSGAIGRRYRENLRKARRARSRPVRGSFYALRCS
jgi:integrase